MAQPPVVIAERADLLALQLLRILDRRSHHARPSAGADRLADGLLRNRRVDRPWRRRRVWQRALRSRPARQQGRQNQNRRCARPHRRVPPCRRRTSPSAPAKGYRGSTAREPRSMPRRLAPPMRHARPLWRLSAASQPPATAEMRRGGTRTATLSMIAKSSPDTHLRIEADASELRTGRPPRARPRHSPPRRGRRVAPSNRLKNLPRPSRTWPRRRGAPRPVAPRGAT